ncbi:LicD family protein [Alkalihalobacillus pseudalcaliphilus]|uniref:LicD family protein n=1 Tax=Alkalihalobacillus pseudalcaliphilus TaxID=79884 RepID=UPI00064DB758|nr:LicD family protein [Alkalihalobacillus pseudalcaliphilus]KMK78349.1 lipopolysaccharide cholinephosphotransferase [Alkalihalobacillus pseudalcaliphilus]
MDMKMVDVQNKIVEIVKYFDDFCNEHNITYYLMGGSALGAVRHSGFIPWDDDFDVFMTYNNYIKFLDVCEEHLDTDKFFLQKENTKEWPLFFSKIRMNNTTYIEDYSLNREMHKGFFIDIMCLNNTVDNKVLRYIQYVSARLITTKTLAERGYITNSKVKKISMLLSRILIKGVIFDGLLKNVRRYNSSETSLVGHFFGRAGFKNTSFPKDYLGAPLYMEFSGLNLPVPQEVDKYLKVRYGGDYMKIPQSNIRDQYPVHAIYVDTEQDYKGFKNEVHKLRR